MRYQCDSCEYAPDSLSDALHHNRITRHAIQVLSEVGMLLRYIY